MSKSNILIVEDNLLVSTAVKDILTDEGYAAETADSVKEAESLLADGDFNLALLDMVLPDGDGRKLLDKWRDERPDLPVVFMTAHADVPTAVEALKGGAYDFLTKPVEKPLLLKTIENALKQSKMARKVDALSQLTSRGEGGEATQVGDIVASSEAMVRTLKLAKTVSQSDFSCLLITGESGTGKGLLANTIHKMGARAKKPFVEVNCSAMPANLIESELFGHKRGAFTDAKEDKIGLFEMADEGTLFLDEIGDMEVSLQAKLLKVIEEQRFRKIGSVNDVSVDVTIIAATNQKIQELSEEGKFRADLYYRLNVIPIHIPPLRERMDDVPHLAEHFVKFFARKFGKEIDGFSEIAMKALLDYSWPGNVREFRNVVERGCILSPGPVIDDPGVLFPSGSGPVTTVAPSSSAGTELKAMPLKRAEELVIRAAMEEAKGNKNKAAQTLGLHRTTLYKKLEEYGIE